VFERDEIPPWRVASNKIFLRDTKLFFASRKCYRLPALFEMVRRTALVNLIGDVFLDHSSRFGFLITRDFGDVR